MTTLTIDFSTLSAWVEFYITGFFVWCIVMSLLGEKLDSGYLVTALIWPIAAAHLVGQLLRKFIRLFLK